MIFKNITKVKILICFFYFGLLTIIFLSNIYLAMMIFMTVAFESIIFNLYILEKIKKEYEHIGK